MRNDRIHSLKDFDAQGLNELWLWLRAQLPKDVDRRARGGGGGGGIQFDTEPQSGDWLYWETTSAGPSGYGLDVKDGSPYGINIEATANGAVNVGADGTGDTSIYATDGSVNIGSATGLVGITSAGTSGGIVIDNNSNGDTEITADGSGSYLTLRATDTIRLIISHGGSGYLLLEGVPASDPAFAHAIWSDNGAVVFTGSAILSADRAYVTVQTGVPTTFSTPLVYDNTAVTGGLYGWDGSAYQKIGPL